MTTARIRTVIETDFMARFPVLQPDVDITGTNSDFDPDNRAYVKMSMSFANIFHPCIGQPKTQTNGFFTVQVFTHTKQGANQLDTISDSALEIIQTAVLDNILFFEYDILYVGQNEGWFSNLIRCNFRAYD